MSIITDLLKIIALCVCASAATASDSAQDKLVVTAADGTAVSGYLIVALDTSDAATQQFTATLKNAAVVYIDKANPEVKQDPSQAVITHTNDFKNGFAKEGFKSNYRPPISF